MWCMIEGKCDAWLRRNLMHDWGEMWWLKGKAKIERKLCDWLLFHITLKRQSRTGVRHMLIRVKRWLWEGKSDTQKQLVMERDNNVVAVSNIKCVAGKER